MENSEWLNDLYMWCGLSKVDNSSKIFEDVKSMIFAKRVIDANAAYWQLENNVIIQGNIQDSAYYVSEIICILLQYASNEGLGHSLMLLNEFVYCNQSDESIKLVKDCYRISNNLINIVLNSSNEDDVILCSEILVKCFFVFRDGEGMVLIKNIVEKKRGIIKKNESLMSLENIINSDIDNFYV